MCIYYLLLWHFYCEEAQVAPDSPEQKKDFSLEAAKLADVVKHLEGYKLVLSNWCTLMTWCVDMMIITEDQWTTQIYLLMFQSRLTLSNLFLEVFLPRRSPAPSLWMSWSDLKKSRNWVNGSKSEIYAYFVILLSLSLLSPFCTDRRIVCRNSFLQGGFLTAPPKFQC